MPPELLGLAVVSVPMHRPTSFLRLLRTPATVLALLLALLVAGCANPDRSGPVGAFSSLSSAQQSLIQRGWIAPDFTPAMVRLALGNPDATTKDTLSETWTYQTLSNRRDPIFRDLTGRPIPPPPSPASDATPPPAGFRIRFFDDRVISAE